MKYLFVLSIVIFFPISVFAARTNTTASFSAARSIISESVSFGNVYLAGLSVVSTASVAGDLSVAGGSIVSAAPIGGDALFVAGSIDSRAGVSGDFRAVGWNIKVEKPVAGDLTVFGLSVNNSGRVSGTVFITALNTTISNGSAGPVTVYGNNVSLSGDFSGDVAIHAAGKISLSPDTKIRGNFLYESPETAIIPTSAYIAGTTTYTKISYLPDAGTSRTLAFASVGLFLFVRILGALILAGLLAGLFPRLAESIVDSACSKNVRDIFLTLLLGFAFVVASPILITLLLITLVGVGIALLSFIAYLLLLLLAFIYGGILAGGIGMRILRKRHTVFWHDGVLGMLAIFLIAFIPFVGLPLLLLFAVFSVGSLLLAFFRFAFPHEELSNV